MVAFPVIVSDEAVGVLTLYAEEANFFNEEEMTLLTELVSDIAFAIGHIDKDERLRYLAYYDELTGLANRSLFLERVGQYLRGEVEQSTQGRRGAYRPRPVQEHQRQPWPTSRRRTPEAGGEWLARNRGDANLVARLGADHFGVVLPNVAPGRDLARLLEAMLRAFIAHPFCLQDTIVRVSATVGVALFPNDGADAETLFRNAEAALKKAKARGDRYLFYTSA